ncbi:hypothetical protein AALO_G00019230, partial [Alosa alosa]
LLDRVCSVEPGAAREVLLQGVLGLKERPEGTGACWLTRTQGQPLHGAAPGQRGPSSETGGVLPQVGLVALHGSTQHTAILELICTELKLEQRMKDQHTVLSSTQLWYLFKPNTKTVSTEILKYWSSGTR